MLSPKAKIVFASITIFYIFCFLWFKANNSPESGWKTIISSDGKGYYDYLPRLFLNSNTKYTNNELQFTSLNQNGNYLNRFYCGTAILESPFFLIATIYAKLFNYPVNGYSQPFAFAIGFAAIFYTLFGIFFLYAFLKRFLQCEENNAIWIIIFTAIGTNLIYYSTVASSFSHAYSFFTITAFVFQLSKTIENCNRKNLFISAFLFSLIIFIRPINILVILLVPALFNNKQSFFNFIRCCLKLKFTLIILLGLIIPIMIQCILWYMQTGNWFEWTYKQEGFYFLRPKMAEILFGFKRGLFIYCPFLLFCIPGIIAGFKINKWKTVWISVFIFIFTYVSSCWWHWTYGDTFGMRPFNDILIAFLILFSLTLMYYKRARKIILIFACIFSFLNLIYAYQFATGITNISTMTGDKFFNLFLKTSDKNKGLYGGANDIEPYAPNGFKIIHTYTNNFDEHDGKNFHVKGDEWLANTEFNYPNLKSQSRNQFIEVSFKRKLVSTHGMKDALFVFHTLDHQKDTTKIYAVTRIKEYPIEKTGEWQTINLSIWLPYSIDFHDKVKVYIWNKGGDEFYIDDYSVKIQIPKW